MASNYLLLLVILCCISKSFQNTKDNTIDDSSPYDEVASDIRKEQNVHNLGALFTNFIETEGANVIGEAISNFGKENAGQLLQRLGSLLANNIAEGEGKQKNADYAPNVLEGLGALMGALGGANQGGTRGNDAGALLQGLGALLGNQGGQGGLDPTMIGNMINMFAQSQGSSKTRAKPGETKKSRKSEKTRSDQPDFEMGDLLSLASNFIGQAQSGKDKSDGQEGNFIGYLPMIMQLINSFTGPEAEGRAKSHESHSWLLPPFLEKLHLVFDHFINSDIGKQVITALGAEKTFKVFIDDEGKFSYQKFGEMMENHSFRRHWIRLVTDRIAGFLVYVSNPAVYKSYLATGQIFLNGYLKSQGFPKAALFDPARPVETISALVNYIAKTYFDIRIKSKEYVKPAVIYLMDLLRLLEKNGPIQSSGTHNEFSDKLTDTINLEIIEPLARVNRAYRFTKAVPSCDRYVLCLVNEENQNDVPSLPGLKNLLNKGSSLVAAWFMSEETKTAFWTYYTDIMDDTDCKALYSEKCNDFHVEELKVTTEYVHNEL